MTNFDIDLSWLWAGLTSLVTGAAGWLFARRKNNAEAALSEVQVAEKLATIWRENTEHLRREMVQDRERFERRINDLEREVHEERSKLIDLQQQLILLQKENNELKAKLRIISQKNGVPAKTTPSEAERT